MGIIHSSPEDQDAPATTSPAHGPGTFGALMHAVGAVIRPGCPNVDGVDFDVTRDPAIRLTVKGRGVTDAELDAIRTAAVGALSFGVDVVVVRAEPAPARTPCPPGSRVERVAAALHRAYYRGACGPFAQASAADRERFAALAVVTLDGPIEEGRV